jgi:predicted transcriptional regulator
MKAVARGERPGAARMSFDSVGALARLLTPDSRRLPALARAKEVT